MHVDHDRYEAELVCRDLARRYQHAVSLHPRQGARAWMTSAASDPLYVTTRLLTDTLARLKLFLQGLEPMGWLVHHDKQMLYNTQLCTTAILKVRRFIIHYVKIYKIFFINFSLKKLVFTK
jgi:hypothetical protein